MNQPSAAPAHRLWRRANALSIGSKLMLIIAGVSLTMTVLAMVASLAIELSFFRGRLLDEYRATARMVATNLEAAVAFQDPRDSKDVLAALSQRESVEAACVYLADGTPLAAYRKAGESPTSPLPAFAAPSALEGDSLVVNEPVVHEGQRIGNVALRADLSEVQSFLGVRSLVFLAILASAAALCFYLAARIGRMFSRPIVDLAETARRISEEKDFSTRHRRTSDDEIGRLVDAFNHMMAEIEHRDEETVRAKEAAEASSRAKDDFLSVISHELRTPMNPIIGYTQVLLRRQRDKSDIRHLTLIRRSAEHLLGLIDDILDYSRFERGVAAFARDSVDYQALCQETIVLLEQEAAEKGLALSASHQVAAGNLPRSIRIVTDKIKFRQVALNLLSNAIKFTDAGSVTLRSLLQRDASGQLRLRVQVEDTGIGIDPKDQGKLFEPFSQVGASLTRSHSGMGLGLAISRKIAHAMGGEIGLRSAAGQGSCFWFEIPVELGGKQAEAPAPLARPNANFTGRRVLLADDQLINRELARGLLEERGVEVVCAGDGQEALELATGSRFDLIILDVKMPRRDGYEAARAIRQSEAPGQRVPIIAMTAHITSRGSEESQDAGMDDFIAKPFDIDKLHSVLEKWLQ